MSEPGAAPMSCRCACGADKAPGGYLLNGEQDVITNGPDALH